MTRVGALPAPSRRAAGLALATAFAIAGLGGLWLTARQPRDVGYLYDDEKEFASAAASLRERGELEFSTAGARPPASGAYREPGYPALVALAWWAAAVPAPDAAAIARLPEHPRAWNAVRALNGLLVALAALAAGLSVHALAGPLRGSLAFALVAASPALRRASTTVMSENLAAAHFALAGLALVAIARGMRRLRLPALVLIALLPLSRSEGLLLLPVAAWLDWRAGRGRPPRVRRLSTSIALLILALPAALWIGRNLASTGHAVLSDRGGLALAVRAEIDAEIARSGVRSAALAWIPLEAARRASERAAPEARWLDYRPTGPGNFYRRTLWAWQDERRPPGVDPLAVDARIGRDALARIARAPGSHLLAGMAVAVRGLFAERSPEWADPFDLTFGLGLLLAAGVLVATGRALARRDLPALALLAPAWALFLFHVGLTELLPRYSVPLLPLAWSALVLATLPRREPG